MTQLNNTNLLNDANLQGYWKLEDVNDSGPNSYNLTNNNTCTFSAGKYANAVNVATSGTKYLSIADGSCPNLEISGSQSWACWVNAPSETPEGNVMAKATGANTHDMYITGGVPHFRLVGLSTTTDINSGITLVQNTWNHIVGVYDSGASKIRIYVNNVKVEATATGSAVDTNGEFDIGSTTSGGNGFDGLIDDVAVFNRALTDDEITLLNAGGRNRVIFVD